MDEKKLLDNLTQIVKQLQEIANTMGVSTGVDSTGGKKGKKKEAEKALNKKEEKKAEETIDIYNKKLNIIPFFDSVKKSLENLELKLDLIYNKVPIEFYNSVKKSLEDIAITVGLMYHNIPVEYYKDSLLYLDGMYITLSNIKNNLNRQNKKTNDILTNILDNSRISQTNEKYLNENIEKLIGINQSMYDSSEEQRKKKKTGITMDKFKNVLGLLGLGAGLYLIIQALTSAGDINVGQVLKVLGVMTVIVGIFIFISKVGSSIKNAAIGFAILSATILFLVLPLLKEMNTLPWGMLLISVIKMGIVMTACIGIMYLMKKITAGDALKSSLGLGVLILVVGSLVIPFLEYLTKIDIDQMFKSLIKFGIILFPLLGIMHVMAQIKASDVIKSSLGLLAMIGLLGFVVIPFLEYLATLSYEPMLKGLLYTGIAILGLSGIALLMGKMINMGLKDILIGGLVVLGFTFLMGFLADQLAKFANKPWADILIGLGIATLALIAFGAVIVGIGLLVANPIVAPLILAGGAAVLGLIILMSGLAESLIKFNQVNASQLEQVGISLKTLSVGLIALLGGTIAGAASGVISGLSSLFGIDPVSQIKKFEKIDSEKIYKLGIGLKFMGEGLKTLSSGEIKLKDITNEILMMTRPLIEFSGALDSFTNAYSKFDKVAMNSDLTKIYKMKVENDNSIQKAIMDLNQQELAVQQAQLDQLRQNGEFLRRIAEGGMSQNVVSNGMTQPQGENISSPSFKTKDNYFNNLKLTSMSMQ